MLLVKNMNQLLSAFENKISNENFQLQYLYYYNLSISKEVWINTIDILIEESYLRAENKKDILTLSQKELDYYLLSLEITEKGLLFLYNNPNSFEPLSLSNFFQMTILEYNAMRDEIRSAHSHIFTTIQLSIAIMGVLIGLAISNANNFPYNVILLCALIPVFSLTALSIIVSESARLERAGNYICLLEEKTNSIFKKHMAIDLSFLAPELKKSEEIYIDKISDTDLSGAIQYEKWIRDLSKVKSIYGRAANFLKFRFLVFFLIPFLSVIFAAFLQFQSDRYEVIIQNYMLIAIFAVFDLTWYLFIIYYGIKLSRHTKKN